MSAPQLHQCARCNNKTFCEDGVCLACRVSAGIAAGGVTVSFARELEESEFRPGLMRAFLARVCGVDVDRAYVSDATELSDFGAGRDEALASVRREYGRDLSHLPGGILLVDALRALETQ